VTMVPVFTAFPLPLSGSASAHERYGGKDDRHCWQEEPEPRGKSE
jgi:hypothetical protein